MYSYACACLVHDGGLRDVLSRRNLVGGERKCTMSKMIENRTKRRNSAERVANENSPLDSGMRKSRDAR